MKPQSTKGFTLIELMIVVAIIGVLAVTIVPALTGAQARARDAGRTAGLQNISAVLETYYSDLGQYPTSAASTPAAGETGKKGCISDAGGTTAPDLTPMFKGGKAPINPQITSFSATCEVPGAYAYYALTKNSIAKSGYILIADVESYTKANAILQGATSVKIAGDDTFENVVTSSAGPILWGKVTNPATESGTTAVWSDVNSNVLGAKATVFSVAN